MEILKELDIEIFYFFNGLAGKSELSDFFIVFFAAILPYFLTVAFIAVLFFSAYGRREKLNIFLAAAASAVVARLVLTELIRFFYHRPRPFAALPAWQLLSENSWSFPSGHAAFFFAAAAAVYFYHKKWGAAFLAFAVFLSLARIAAGVHYLSDVIGGIMVGAASAWCVFRLQKMIFPAKVTERR